MFLRAAFWYNTRVMDIVWQISGVLFALVGIVGCVVPVIPGPVVTYCGLLCLLPTARPPTTTVLVVFGAATAVATLLDYVVPALGAKKFHCSKLGVFGCVVGTMVGLFFFPIGLLLGPFLGAVAGELLSGKSAAKSAWGGFGAFLGFLAGVLIKLAVCGAMAFWVVLGAWFKTAT